MKKPVFANTKDALLARKRYPMLPLKRQGLPFAQRVSALLVTLFDSPVLSSIVAFAIYALFAALYHPIWATSEVAYYNYLADAFLHGQLHLRVIPPTVHDLSLYQGNYYLYWSPMPAILMIPFIAVFGLQFSDILFTIVIGALNVGLVSLLLRCAFTAKIIRTDRLRRAVLVMGFAFGSVHLPLALFGRVWYTGQLVGFMFVMLTYVIALKKPGFAGFLLAGLTISAALLTRNHLVFAGIWPAVYLLYRNRSVGWKKELLYSLAGVVPVLCAVACLAIYNMLRFGNMSDNGLDYHRMAPLFVDDYKKYGAFHTHYIWTNIYYQYLYYPLILHSDFFFGGSLFLLTPVFFGVFVGGARLRPLWMRFSLLTSIVLVAIPILLLMGTGWIQFGPRYTLDFTAPMLMLTAHGIQFWRPRLLYLLVSISIAQYIIGSVLIAQVI